MTQDGGTLFDYMAEGARLHVVCGGRAVPWGLDEVFGEGEFTELRAVSYVSSSQFLAKLLERFRRAEVVLGIDSPRALARVRDMVTGRDVRFYNGLGDRARDMAEAGALRVMYSDMQRVIHSKIYLLSNPEEGLWRAAVGSANLTRNAFVGGPKAQYEELFVLDGREAWDLYERRFEAIAAQTVDYLPEVCRERWREARELVAVDDPEVAAEILRRRLAEGDAQMVFAGSSAEYDELRGRFESGDPGLSREDEALIEIYRGVVRKTRGGYALKKREQVEKAFDKSIRPRALALTCAPQAADLPVPMLVERAGEDGARRLFYAEATSADGKHVDGTLVGGPYSESGMSGAEIDGALGALEGFIETYRNHTSEEVGDEYLSWLYEALLFAMASPMVADVRDAAAEEYGENQLPNIPVYLAIGGRGDAGKSTMMDYMHRLLDGTPAPLSRMQHKTLAAGLGNKLDGYFDLGTRFPLMADDVPKSFFTGHGDDVIKGMTNSLVGRAYGAVICTTNADEYSPGEGSRRRVKYLPLDVPFEKTMEGQRACDEALERCPSRLEREFCARFLSALDGGAESYTWSEGRPDSLVLARAVLRGLYADAGREAPAYFPAYPVDNTTIEAKREWSAMWSDESMRGRFVPVDGGSRLRVRVEELFPFKPTRAERDRLTQGIPPQVATKTGGTYLVLNAEQFFLWLGEENPFSRRSLWRRLRDWWSG